MPVKERPIIFSSESVQQILAGRKTMTRRPVKPQPNDVRWTPAAVGIYGGWIDEHGYPVRCPYGAVGERLWVRETHFIATGPADGSPPSLDNSLVHFKAGAPTDLLHVAAKNGLWRSPLHMPRWASRLTLELTSVGVERLQDISEEDAVAEGVEVDEAGHAVRKHDPIAWGSARGRYAEIWEELNAKRGFSWESNPYCWVLSF